MNVKSKPELLLVMPVYNEEASVRKVVIEWFNEVENWTEDFIFLAINDGSRDKTKLILDRLRDQLGERFHILDQKNIGHGQSCLKGYRYAQTEGIPYVFQFDSDGQCDPQYFFRLWRNREKFDVIYGYRAHRDDGQFRIVASIVLKIAVLLFCAVHCVDANSPYRLIRTSVLEKALGKIPPDFSLANIALAVLLKRQGVAHGQVRIRFRDRYGGEPSVAIGKFGKKAIELIKQLLSL